MVSVQCVRGVYEKFSVFRLHEREVCHSRDECHTAAACAKYCRDLWNHAGCHCLRHIDFAETVQSISCLLQTHTGTVYQSDDRSTCFLCKLIQSRDFFCMHFADSTAHHRRILAVYVYQAAVDHTVTSNYTIGWCLHAGHVEICASGSNLSADFHKAVFIQQRGDSCAR